MKIGILQTGGPPSALEPEFGDYPAMFARLLGCDPVAFKVKEGDWPRQVEDFDAYLITGSSAGVYEDLHWIDPLKGFLRRARGRAALVGVCFGHQIMAEAFGGQVIKSPRGWGVGLHSYNIIEREPWMDGARQISAPASHQDQVVEAPPGARVCAASAFTPFAALAYPDHRAISFQFHPEFTPAYAAALIESRRGDRYSDDQADAAVASLQQPNDRLKIAGWIKAFLQDGAEAAQAKVA